MSKRKPSGNCRRCQRATYNKDRICPKCNGELNQIAHDLDLLKRYPHIVEPFDEEDWLKRGLE